MRIPTLDEISTMSIEEVCAVSAPMITEKLKAERKDMTTGEIEELVREISQARRARKIQLREAHEADQAKHDQLFGNDYANRRELHCQSCDHYCKSGCKDKCKLAEEKVAKLAECPEWKWKKYTISLVIPARSEGRELQLTIDSGRKAGADEIIVVDDGENEKYSGADIVITNKTAVGPAMCRNAGLQAATGDFIVFSDSHVRFTSSSFQEMANHSHKKGCLSVAITQSLGGRRNWTAYGGSLCSIDGGYDAKPAQSQSEECTAVYGSVYGAMRLTWEAIGGWPETLCWGYNEQALSLAAIFAGISIRPYKPMITHHMFKKRFNYPVSNRKTHANRVLTHFYLFEDFETRWVPHFKKYLKDGWEIAEPLLRQKRFLDIRKHFRSKRKISDDQLYKYINDNRGNTFSASRRMDSPTDHVKVCLFTPHAPGREWARDGYIETVNKCGRKIDKMVMIEDTPRPDIVKSFPNAIHVSTKPLKKRTAKHMSEHMAYIWNTGINNGIADSMDWVWSLEDDVEPELGVLEKLVSIAVSSKDAGIISIPLDSRKGSLMVYQLKSIHPFVIDRKKRYRGMSGVHEVGSVHVGCTLIKADILRNMRVTPTPNDSGRGGFGHEWSIMKMCHRIGLKIYCDFDIKCKHKNPQ